MVELLPRNKIAWYLGKKPGSESDLEGRYWFFVGEGLEHN